MDTFGIDPIVFNPNIPMPTLPKDLLDQLLGPDLPELDSVPGLSAPGTSESDTGISLNYYND